MSIQDQRAVSSTGERGRSSGDLLPSREIVGLDRRRFLGLAGLAGASGALFASAAPAEARVSEYSQPQRVFDPSRHGKIHTLPSTSKTVRVGVFDPAAPAVLEIDSGDIVHYPNTWVAWANEAKFGMSFAAREPIRKRFRQGPQSLVGPVAIRGAEPGDAIECRMLRLRPIGWGWNSAPKGVGALPSDFPDSYLHYVRFDEARRYAQFANGVRIPLAPIQGAIAAQPAADKPVSALEAGAYGGCVQLPQLVAGTSLFVAVQVPGAHMWTGDSHAAQGDGVVDQTAIETAMEDLRIQYVLHKKIALASPIAETPTHWIVVGFGATLENALTTALRQMIAWLSPVTGLSRQDIYALCSIAGSFRAMQYADQTHSNYRVVQTEAVSAMLPKHLFDRKLLAQIAGSVRPSA